MTDDKCSIEGCKNTKMNYYNECWEHFSRLVKIGGTRIYPQMNFAQKYNCVKKYAKSLHYLEGKK